MRACHLCGCSHGVSNLRTHVVAAVPQESIRSRKLLVVALLRTIRILNRFNKINGLMRLLAAAGIWHLQRDSWPLASGSWRMTAVQIQSTDSYGLPWR